MEINKRELIEKYLGKKAVNNSMDRASIDHYKDTGSISGFFLLQLEKMLSEHAREVVKYTLEDAAENAQIVYVNNDCNEIGCADKLSILSREEVILKSLNLDKWKNTL